MKNEAQLINKNKNLKGTQFQQTSGGAKGKGHQKEMQGKFKIYAQKGKEGSSHITMHLKAMELDWLSSGLKV